MFERCGALSRSTARTIEELNVPHPAALERLRAHGFVIRDSGTGRLYLDAEAWADSKRGSEYLGFVLVIAFAIFLVALVLGAR